MPRLYWSTETGPGGQVVRVQAEGRPPVGLQAVALEPSDVTFPPPGGGVAVVPVGGGGLQELRGTSDGQTLTWDAGAGQWVAGAAGTSPLTVATEVDDFRFLSSSDPAAITGSTGVVPTSVVVTPVLCDLSWVAYSNNSPTSRFELLAGSTNNPGTMVIHADGGANDYITLSRAFGIQGTGARNSGVVYTPNMVADHSWITRTLTSSGQMRCRFGLFQQIDVGFTTSIWTLGSFRGLGWFLDPELTGNSNLWAGGASFDTPALFDTGISVGAFVSPFRRFSVRADADTADLYHWLIDDVEVFSGSVNFNGAAENLKPAYYVRSNNGASARCIVDYYQTVTKQLSR